MGEKGRIARAAGLMSVATFISRVLGYARDMLVAFYLGASGHSDTFFVAFRIPNLMRELLAEGSMSAAVVPVLSEYREKGEGDARELVRVVFTFLLLVVGAVCAMGAVFAPQVVAVIAPGFLEDPQKFETTVFLTRVMFPFLLFVSLAALVMGSLNTKRVFFVPALAPAVLNVSIITTLLLLASRLDQPILALSIGVTIGGFMQFAFQCPSFFGHGYSMRPSFGFSNPGLRKILRLVLPVTLGMAVAQINILVSNILASFLPGGSITYLFYSMRLIQFPIGVFGVAMGMAVIPSLSAHAQKGEFAGLREDFSFSLRLLFFISVPAMAGLIALREPIVNMLFQRGLFDYQATRGTAEALLYYSLGIWAMVGVRVAAGAFYSMQDTKTPVKCAAAALLANAALSVLLMGPMRHSGLALANALSSMLNFTLLFFFLRRRLGRLDARRTLRSLAKIALASALMAALGGLLLRGELWSRPGEGLVKAAWLSGTVALCVLVYALVCRMARAEEFDYVVGIIRQRLAGGGGR